MPQNRQPEPTLLVRSLALGLPPGFEITAHDHGWPQLVFASGGALVVETDRHAWIAPSQRAVWVPAETARQHGLWLGRDGRETRPAEPGPREPSRGGRLGGLAIPTLPTCPRGRARAAEGAGERALLMRQGLRAK